MGSLTRGPLPAAVYWRRRMLFVGLSLLLVVGLARVLSGSADGSDPATATPVAGEPSVGAGAGASAVTGPEAEASTADPAEPEEKAEKKNKKKQQASAPPEPTGPCADWDVRVRPVVSDAVAGRDVTVTLRLRTGLTAACTWEVSPSTVTLKITSGSDEIWTTRQCRRAVPTQEVVLRRESAVEVDLTWHARRSDSTCSRTSAWALPGYYHVAAAALAGEPKDTQFELTAPVAPTITASPEPEPKTDAKNKKKNKKNRG